MVGLMLVGSACSDSLGPETSSASEATLLTAEDLAERFTSDQRLVYLCDEGVNCRTQALTPDEYTCAAGRLLEQHGAEKLSDMLPIDYTGGTLDEIGFLLTGVAGTCVEPPKPPPAATTAATPLPTTPEVPVETSTTTAEAAEPENDDEDAMAGVRDALVDLLIQRGAEPGEAEVEADRLMAGDFDGERAKDALTLEMQIYEEWMLNYPLHPVMGGLWTEEEASCAIMEMFKQSGVAGTERLLTIAQLGAMSTEDATALVQPVADCADLRAMTLEDMRSGGVDNPECLLAPVTEEQIVTWHAAEFSDGMDAYWDAVDRDLDLTCLGGPA